MAVHRDASMYQPIPEGTWVLCLGWYMHALFTMRHGFPLHRNLRPIFVSFHCNKRNLLTPDAVEYLRRHGPVGCRDWTTTHLLTSMGVPAFFSGCLTTTIGGVFPDAPAPRADAPVAYVDVQTEAVPEDAVTYGHSSLKVRRRSFVANAKIALERLDTYRREHSRVITSRLHCHLPLRSIGVETEFVPVNPADVRFSGLIDITDQEFDAIRSGLTEKLERILRLMIAGAPEADVYADWREATADDVAAAEQELRRGVALQAPAAKWATRVPRVVGATKTYASRAANGEPPVDCAVYLHPRHVRGAGALLDSLAEHTSRPVRLWALDAAGQPRRPARDGLPGGDRQRDPAQVPGQARSPARSRAPARPDPGRRAARGAADAGGRHDRRLRARRPGPRLTCARRSHSPGDHADQRLRRHQHGREPAARPPGRRGRAAPRGAGPARVRLRRLQRGAAGPRSRPAAPGGVHGRGA